MKKHILRLIADDIKITRLINVLRDIEISADSYFLGNSQIIFSLMGISENEIILESYCQMIEKADDLKKYGSNSKIMEFAEEVYTYLLSIED